jgi:hypothetical protein
MRFVACLAVLVGLVGAIGCQKPADEGPAVSTDSPSSQGAGGVTAATPDVGAVTPVTSTSLDDAAGGGVNSAAMRKAKKISAEGVGSVNNAQKQGYATDDGN